MFDEKKLFEGDYGYSLNFVIRRFESMLDKYGNDMVMNNRRFQKVREVWAAAVFALGFYQIYEQLYWIEPIYENTPDARLHFISSYKRIKGAGTDNQMQLEVKDWEEHTNLELGEFIIDNLKNKKYPKEFVLLVHGIKSDGTKVDLEKAYALLNDELDLDIDSIWFLSSVKGTTKLGYRLVRLYKGRGEINFDIESAVRSDSAINTYDIVKFSRGTDCKPIAMGPLDMPLPDL